MYGRLAAYRAGVIRLPVRRGVEVCARSSTGQSIGLRIRGLGVQIPPGAPAKFTILSGPTHLAAGLDSHENRPAHIDSSIPTFRAGLAELRRSVDSRAVLQPRLGN